jgi:hypothetical protein
LFNFTFSSLAQHLLENSTTSVVCNLPKAMNMNLILKPAVLATAGMLLSMAGTASAESTWQMGGCGANGTQTQCSVTSDGVTATVTAYSSDPDGNGGKFSNSGASGTTFQQYGAGLGIISKDPTPGATPESTSTGVPDHAIDNKGYPGADNAELVHLSFSKAVDLSNVAVSWTYTDSDALIFRWNSATGPTVTDYSTSSLPTAVGQTLNGWTLVAANAFAGYNTWGSGGSIGVSGTAYSSHWLVSTAFGLGGDGNVDAFKLSAFTAAVCTNSHATCTPGTPDTGGNVPEPGTLWLAALAVLGVTQRKHLSLRSLKLAPMGLRAA